MTNSGEVLALAADQAIIHGGVVSSTDPVTITTPGVPWSFAASFPLGGDPSAEVLEATVTVSGGSAGISCASVDYRSLDDEVIVSPAEHVQRCELLVGNRTDARLLIRTGPDAAPSTVAIHQLIRRSATAADHAADAVSPMLRPMPNWSRFYGPPAGSLAERFRYREFQQLDGPVRYRWLEDLTLILYPGDQTSRAVYVSGVYEPNTATVLKQLLTRGSVLLDVGANVGLFTLLGSRWVGTEGRVLSFEPSSRERKRLDEQVALNRLTNVIILPQAVADHEGRGRLRVAAAEYAGLNTLGDDFGYSGVNVVATEDVPLVTLDAAVAAAGLTRVSVIKLDIEGAEYAALVGARRILRELRPVLVVEVARASLSVNNHATPEQMTALLSGAGYRLYVIDDSSARLCPVESLDGIDGQNVVAAPRERNDLASHAAADSTL